MKIEDRCVLAPEDAGGYLVITILGERMSFRPVNTSHAIVEAVFGVNFGRGWTHNEIAQVKNSHHLWRDMLPRMSDIQGVDVTIGADGELTKNASLPGVMFDRFNPDGTVSWRLAIRDNSIIVNCLSYDRWLPVSQQALELMRNVARIGAAHNKQIGTVFLQYIDQFNWVGESRDYDLSKLFQLDGRVLPTSLAEKSKLWHIHQGWFEDLNAPLKSKTLNKVDLSGLQNEEKRYIVRLDNLLQSTIEPAQPAADLEHEKSWITDTFDVLHEMNKDTLRAFLTPEAAKGLGL